MAITKLTALFQSTTQPSSGTDAVSRTGGWSESWYYDSSNPELVRSRFFVTASGGAGPGFTRMGLCTSAVSMVGIRTQIIDPVGGGAASIKVFYPGHRAGGTDIPQMALLCTARSSLPNTRRVVLRGIPDDNVIGGEYKPTTAFAAALDAYLKSLVGWRFRGRDLTVPSYPILSATAITDPGPPVAHTAKLVLEGPSALAAGDMVRVLRTQEDNGNLVGGRFKVISTAAAGAEVFIRDWHFGDTTGGKVRKDLVVYPAVTGVTPGEIITRRVGRPFRRYVGRRSRRR